MQSAVELAALFPGRSAPEPESERYWHSVAEIDWFAVDRGPELRAQQERSSFWPAQFLAEARSDLVPESLKHSPALRPPSGIVPRLPSFGPGQALQAPVQRALP